MRMSKPIKGALWASVIVLFCGLLLSAAFIFLGGYWENLPVLEEISGPKRFKQYVGKPEDYGAYDITGGYSGLPQGSIVTVFSLRHPLDEKELSSEWIKSEDLKEDLWIHQQAESGTGSRAFTVYRKQKTDARIYLILGKQSGKGALYIP